ncbi:hypothetical protein Sjap_003248 [Stephania japonica]|uniref:Uncharacterized protein n=1 Tax=Stephania japonica TaxID=461633 RepID=A0AAP0PTC6_9MAGN
MNVAIRYASRLDYRNPNPGPIPPNLRLQLLFRDSRNSFVSVYTNLENNPRVHGHPNAMRSPLSNFAKRELCIRFNFNFAPLFCNSFVMSLVHPASHHKRKHVVLRKRHAITARVGFNLETSEIITTDAKANLWLLVAVGEAPALFEANPKGVSQNSHVREMIRTNEMWEIYSASRLPTTPRLTLAAMSVVGGSKVNPQANGSCLDKRGGVQTKGQTHVQVGICRKAHRQSAQVRTCNTNADGRDEVMLASIGDLSWYQSLHLVMAIFSQYSRSGPITYHNSFVACSRTYQRFDKCRDKETRKHYLQIMDLHKPKAD